MQEKGAQGSTHWHMSKRARALERQVLGAGWAAGSQGSPLGANFSQLLHDISVPKSADGEQQETGVGDGIREDDSNRIQTLRRFVVDVAANAGDVVLTEVRVPELRSRRGQVGWRDGAEAG